MMTRWRRTTACERAAHWISLSLDNELGTLERAALARHLGRCDRCRETSAELGALTSLIRAEPQIEPPRPVDIVVPAWARGRTRAALQAAIVALAAAGAIFAGAAGLSQSGSVGSLGLPNADEQRLMAQEHVRIEPVVFLVAPEPSASSFASRALL
jgi:anti-sigma factor RsiW